MDYRYLRVFIDAAETLNFATTAKHMKIAASAVTRQIQLFEDSVGESLFIRSNQRVLLTERGREILELVKPLRDWEAQTRRRVVRIAGLPAALEAHFWPLVTKHRLAEKVDLDVIEAVTAVAIRMIEEGKVDLAIVNRKQESSLVSYFSIAQESFVLISKEPVKLEDVRHHTWIYGETGDLLRQIGGVKGDHPFIRTGAIQRIYDLVEAGAGIAVVPDSSALTKRKFHKRTLDVKSKPIYLALPNFSKLPPHIETVYELLTKN